MPDPKPNEPDETLTVQDFRNVLDEEVTALSKASELRIREFAGFVTAYAAGELTPAQAMDKLFRYKEVWGEAFPGVPSVQGLTDEDLLARVEKSAGKYTTREETRKQYERMFRNRDRTPG